MTEFFLNVVNMSISASWLVFAVLLLRLLLKKAPKWINVLLWGIVAVRLICPFSFESVLSLIPSSQTINPEIALNAPVIDSGVTIIDNVINPIIGEATISIQPEKGVNLFQYIMPYLAGIWLVGIAVLLIYTLISFLRLKNKIGTAILLRDNIYQSEAVVSPFVLGIIKPKIYLPFNMNGQDMEHVIAHEQAHIRRKDYLWKPLGFLILTLHWFNPMVWLGYILLCRDIELACDEKVVKEFNNEQRADYSQALLTCSVNRRMIAACPLAFGEVGVKDRIKSVLNYKKPAFWIIIVAIIVSITVAVCFLTNPLNSSIYNSRYETGKCLYSYVVSADKETKSNELIFDITSDGKVSKTFGEGTTEELGVLKESDYTAEELEAAIKNQDAKLNIGTIKTAYKLSNYIFLQKSNGTVYLVQFFSDGKIMSVFKLNRIGKSDILNGTYKLSEELYFNGSYSYIPDFENDRIEIKTNGGMNIYHFTGEVLSTGGLYEEINLNKENFSNLFENSEYKNADDLLTNNEKTWHHSIPQDFDGYPYMLLLQKDGSLCIAFADLENGTPTRLRCIYKLEYEGLTENNTPINKEDVFGSPENPYQIGATVRMKHGSPNNKDASYDYNVTLTQVLTGKEAEEKLKELSTNFEEEKFMLEKYDLYLANVVIDLNEGSTPKDSLPPDIGMFAVGEKLNTLFIEARFDIAQNSIRSENGEWNNWVPILSYKGEARCLAFTVGASHGVPGIFQVTCFALPETENPAEFSEISYIYRCDDVYREKYYGSGKISIPSFPASIELKAWGLKFCEDECTPSEVINCAIQGYARVYYMTADGEIDGEKKIYKFKKTVPEPMVADLKEQGLYEDTLEKLSKEYYYLIKIDGSHYAYIHLEGNDEALADSIAKSAIIDMIV